MHNLLSLGAQAQDLIPPAAPPVHLVRAKLLLLLRASSCPSPRPPARRPPPWCPPLSPPVWISRFICRSVFDGSRAGNLLVLRTRTTVRVSLVASWFYRLLSDPTPTRARPSKKTSPSERSEHYAVRPTVVRVRGSFIISGFPSTPSVSNSFDFFIFF